MIEAKDLIMDDGDGEMEIIHIVRYKETPTPEELSKFKSQDGVTIAIGHGEQFDIDLDKIPYMKFGKPMTQKMLDRLAKLKEENK